MFDISMLKGKLGGGTPGGMGSAMPMPGGMTVPSPGQGLGAMGEGIFGAATQQPGMGPGGGLGKSNEGLMDGLNAMMMQKIMGGMGGGQPQAQAPAAPQGPLGNPAAMQGLMQAMQSGGLRAGPYSPMGRRF